MDDTEQSKNLERAYDELQQKVVLQQNAYLATRRKAQRTFRFILLSIGIVVSVISLTPDIPDVMVLGLFVAAFPFILATSHAYSASFSSPELRIGTGQLEVDYLTDSVDTAMTSDEWLEKRIMALGDQIRENTVTHEKLDAELQRCYELLAASPLLFVGVTFLLMAFT